MYKSSDMIGYLDDLSEPVSAVQVTQDASVTALSWEIGSVEVFICTEDGKLIKINKR